MSQRRWDAVKENDEAFDGKFYYAVKTTGIFCKPSCKSKLPKRDNVLFYDTSEEAMKNGFRPCKRCRPDIRRHNPENEILQEVISIIEENVSDRKEFSRRLNEIGMSRHRLDEIFRKHYKITLKEYSDKVKIEKAKMLLRVDLKEIVHVAYDIGFKSLSGFYSFFKKHTGYTPREYREKVVKK